MRTNLIYQKADKAIVWLGAEYPGIGSATKLQSHIGPSILRRTLGKHTGQK